MTQRVMKYRGATNKVYQLMLEKNKEFYTTMSFGELKLPPSVIKNSLDYLTRDKKLLVKTEDGAWALKNRPNHVSMDPQTVILDNLIDAMVAAEEPTRKLLDAMASAEPLLRKVKEMQEAVAKIL